MITTTEVPVLPTPQEVYAKLREVRVLADSADSELVLAVLRGLLECSVQGHGAFTMFCARCRGRAGGSRTSPAKAKVVRASLQKARRKRWPGRRRPKS